jgi:hypothetical protein
MPEHRFPPPWSVDEADAKLDRRCFIVRDANGQARAFVYFGWAMDRRAAASCSPATGPADRRQHRQVAGDTEQSPRPLSTHFHYDLNSGHFAALRSWTSWANSDRTADKLGSRSGRGLYLHRCISPRRLAVSAWVQTYVV